MCSMEGMSVFGYLGILSSSAPQDTVVPPRQRANSAPPESSTINQSNPEPMVTVHQAKIELEAELKELFLTKPMVRLEADFMYLRAENRSTFSTIKKSSLDELKSKARDAVSGYSEYLCDELKRVRDGVADINDAESNATYRGTLYEELKKALKVDDVTFSPSCFGHEETFFSGGRQHIYYGIMHYNQVLDMNDYIQLELERRDYLNSASADSERDVETAS